MRINLLERIAAYLYGYARVSISGYTSRALTEIMRAQIDYWSLESTRVGVSFFVAQRNVKALKCATARIGCTVNVEEKYGAAATVIRYGARPGLVVGAFAFALILWASTFFIWDISVSGNKRLSERAIVESFEEYGVKYGAFIPSLDLDTLCHEYLINSDEIAWASVNLSGTRADIVVKERGDTPRGGESFISGNIVAAEDGQIVRFLVSSGRACVHIGDVVRKGEVLAEGVYDTERNGEITGHYEGMAAGVFYAQVLREYTVTVPLRESVKEYTGAEFSSKEYKFFTQGLKNFKKPFKNDGFYDTIVDNERVILFGFLKLPVFVTNTVMREYTLRETEYTPEQARERAEVRMMKKLSEELHGCELLSKKTDGTLTDGEYTLKCSVYCIAEIGREVETEYGTEDNPS